MPDRFLATPLVPAVLGISGAVLAQLPVRGPELPPPEPAAPAEAAVALERQGLFRARGGDVTKAAFDQSARVMVSCGEIGDVLLWNLATGEPLGVVQHAATSVRDLDVSPDGRFAAIACRGDVPGLFVVDLERRALERLDPAPCRGVAFAPAGDRLAWITWDMRGLQLHVAAVAAGADPDARRSWSLPASVDTVRFAPSGDRVVLTAERSRFGPDGHFVVDLGDPEDAIARRLGRPLARNDDGAVLTHENYRLSRGEEQLAWVASVAVSRRGGHAASIGVGSGADRQQFVRIWRDGADEVTAYVEALVRTVAVAPDGTVVAGDERGGLHLIRPDAEPVKLGGHAARGVRQIVFTPDTRYVAALTTGGITWVDREDFEARYIAGSFAIGPGEAGAEFWIADRSGARRFFAPRASYVGELVSWPDDVSARMHRDSFGGPQEDVQQVRSLMRVGLSDAMVLRQGRTPRLHWFDPREDRFEPLVDTNLPLANAGAVEVVWNPVRQVLVFVESQVERLGSGAAAGVPAVAPVVIPGEAGPRIRGGAAPEIVTAQHAIRVVGAEGRSIRSFSIDAAPTTLSVSPDGEAYLMATTDRRLLRFGLDESGAEILIHGETSTAKPFRWIGWLDDDLAIAHDGERLWAFHPGTLEDRGAVDVPGPSRRIQAAALDDARTCLALATGAVVGVYQIERRAR